MQKPGELKKPLQVGTLRKDCQHTVQHHDPDRGGFVCTSCGKLRALFRRDSYETDPRIVGTDLEGRN